MHDRSLNMRDNPELFLALFHCTKLRMENMKYKDLVILGAASKRFGWTTSSSVVGRNLKLDLIRRSR